MLELFKHGSFRNLFLSQVLALVGTGLTTIALGLLAFSLAGANAGAVLGTALSIKMIAYVVLAPIAPAITGRFPRRSVLVFLDLIRAVVVVFLPFITEIWQIYILVLLLQSASAAYTPTLQATIPDILPDEEQYTRALSLTRLASDLENIVSPLLAAALLTVISFHSLFIGTCIGFLCAAFLVHLAVFPQSKLDIDQGFLRRSTKGISIYLRTPRLRGVLSVSLAVSGGASMVLVNTVVIVQGAFALDERATAFALAAYGAGSMTTALLLPKMLNRFSDRNVMISGAIIVLVCTTIGTLISSYPMLLVLWFCIGTGFGASITPAGRVVRRSSHPKDRVALFAAQFSLSHACWLISYPLAGWAGSTFGLPVAFLIMAIVSASGLLSAILFWPKIDPTEVHHLHVDLNADDPHLLGATSIGSGFTHSHVFVIDDKHPRWPKTHL